jgi:UDP-glucose 4-epimerase
MKILVTGGAGYIGTALVDALSRREEVSQVVVYDNLSRSNPNLFISEPMPSGRIRFIRGDILDTRRLARELEGVDLVYHLAARVSTPFADADFHGLDQVNHWGCAELSYLLETHPVGRVVYLSSTSVYGASEESVTLETPPQPRTAYGISKFRGEQMLTRLEGRVPVHIVRCANVYGYNKSMRFDAVINRFMFDAHYSGRLTIHGSGQQTRAFVHIESLVRCLLAAGLEGALSGVSNVVERRAAVEEIAREVADVYPGLELLYIQQDMRLRNLYVDPDPRLANLEALDTRSLGEQLQEFRHHFAFEPQRIG